MAEWDAAYINDLPDSAFAVILAGGQKDEDGRTVPRSLRKLPHHNAAGAIDMPHLRNAMSRESQSDMPDEMHARAHAHLMGHAKSEDMSSAKALMPVKAKALTVDEEQAWFAGRLPRRLLAIPFGGPIPSAKAPHGVDYDGEWFSPRTDIYGGIRHLRENRERLVDFSHSYAPPDRRYGDPTGMMTGHILGKSILDPDPDEDGWWVDIWLKAGEKRVRMIQALAERGAQLFGSSQPIPSKSRRDPETGEILVWPFVMETLSPAPSNTYSVLRPAKAVLEEADLAGIAISAQMRSLIEDMRDLDSDLRRTSLAGDDEAKSGRVLPDLSPLIAELEERTQGVSARLSSMLERLKQKETP